MEKVLLAYDGSKPSKDALNFTKDFAKKLNAKVYVLYVINVDVATELFGEYHGKIAEELEEKAKEVINEAVNVLKESGIEAEGVIDAGTPAEKIVENAKKFDVYVIILGAHGYSGIKKLLIGSTSEKVIRLSDRPVLIVK
ncbi:universal stress protein A [Ignicoccus islandicus DSM 13165]|uniref:Universal stress protein A n=1 Tax=Ignicoccus islandicus DSM 13165 TaxID=940295 RepID=A0A0U3E110_9CREN|nr:universal stress protein [Ignicoccus islandicus]ALU11595.1 universal stress protein A [Ignicoccus islandicus DSM 13165]